MDEMAKLFEHTAATLFVWDAHVSGWKFHQLFEALTFVLGLAWGHNFTAMVSIT
jgi:hypothetical protein